MEYTFDPNVPQDWYFTFGCGTLLRDKVAKFHGTYEEARNQMFTFYGNNWCAQLDEEKFQREKKEYGLVVIEDNKKTSLEYVVYNTLLPELKGITEDYGERICNRIYKEVAEDVALTSGYNDGEGYTEYDISLGIGRVLCHTLGLDY